MTTRSKAFTAFGILPVALAAAAGIASASPAGQPGMAADDGQPGMSASPRPQAAPQQVSPPTASLADWVPEAPQVLPVPSRPQPQQQTQPQTQMWVRPQVSPQVDEEEPAVVEASVPEPVLVPVDPHLLRLGTGTVTLPEVVDVRSRDKAQSYVDLVEWNVASFGDSIGLPQQQSDRMAAAAVGGGGIGAGAGALVAAPVAGVTGCGVGAIVGAVAGAAIGGIPTAGAMAVPGALIGAAVGCGVGGVAGAGTGAVAGAIGGGLVGAGSGALVASATDDVAPPAQMPALLDPPEPMPPADPVVAETFPAAAPVTPPLTQAVVSVSQQVRGAGEEIAVAVEQVAADPVGAQVVGSLSQAVDALAPLDPNVFGQATPALNDALGAVQAALGGH